MKKSPWAFERPDIPAEDIEFIKTIFNKYKLSKVSKDFWCMNPNDEDFKLLTGVDMKMVEETVGQSNNMEVTLNYENGRFEINWTVQAHDAEVPELANGFIVSDELQKFFQEKTSEIKDINFQFLNEFENNRKEQQFIRNSYKKLSDSQKLDYTNEIIEKIRAAGINVEISAEKIQEILKLRNDINKMTVDVQEFEDKKKEIEKIRNYIPIISDDNKVLVTEQEFIDFQTSLIACKKFIDDLPYSKLPNIKWTEKNDRNENINIEVIVQKKGERLVLTTLNNTLIYNFETKEVENNYLFNAFKNYNATNNCCDVLVKAINDNLGKQLGEQRSKLKKMMQENAVLSGKALNELSEEETKELKDKLKDLDYEQIEGIYVHKNKKIALPPEDYIKEVKNAKLLVDHNHKVYLLPENFAFRRINEKGKNESNSTPDTLTDEEFVELKTTKNNLGTRFGEAVEQANNVLIRIQDDISVYNARKRLQNKIKNLPKETGIEFKDGKLFLYFEKRGQYVEAEIKQGKINILPAVPGLADLTESRPANGILSQLEDLSNTLPKVNKMMARSGLYWNGKPYEYTMAQYALNSSLDIQWLNHFFGTTSSDIYQFNQMLQPQEAQERLQKLLRTAESMDYTGDTVSHRSSIGKARLRTFDFFAEQIRNDNIGYYDAGAALSTGVTNWTTVNGTEVIAEPEYMFKNGFVAGLAYDNNIILHPDYLSSNAAVHEYTHLWDTYTQKTNPELWNKGLELFKDTKYWNEVISDPNYQDIKDDENLVLSEIHSRICGDIAEKVLARIAELDGEQAKLDAIDWDKETWNYISTEMELSTEYKAKMYDKSILKKDLQEFLSTPMKDLIQEKNIFINTDYHVTTAEELKNWLEAYDFYLSEDKINTVLNLLNNDTADKMLVTNNKNHWEIHIIDKMKYPGISKENLYDGQKLILATINELSYIRDNATLQKERDELNHDINSFNISLKARDLLLKNISMIQGYCTQEQNKTLPLNKLPEAAINNILSLSFDENLPIWYKYHSNEEQKAEVLLKMIEINDYFNGHDDIKRPTAAQFIELLNDGWGYEEALNGFRTNVSDPSLNKNYEIIDHIGEGGFLDSDIEAAEQAKKIGIPVISPEELHFAHGDSANMYRYVDSQKNRQLLNEHLIKIDFIETPEQKKLNTLIKCQKGFEELTGYETKDDLSRNFIKYQIFDSPESSYDVLDFHLNSDDEKTMNFSCNLRGKGFEELADNSEYSWNDFSGITAADDTLWLKVKYDISEKKFICQFEVKDEERNYLSTEFEPNEKLCSLIADSLISWSDDEIQETIFERNKFIETVHEVADTIIQKSIYNSEEGFSYHPGFDDVVEWTGKSEEWIKENKKYIDCALSYHNDNELLDYNPEDAEYEDTFSLYFCGTDFETNTLFKLEDGRFVRKTEYELSIEESFPGYSVVTTDDLKFILKTEGIEISQNQSKLLLKSINESKYQQKLYKNEQYEPILYLEDVKEMEHISVTQFKSLCLANLNDYIKDVNIDEKLKYNNELEKLKMIFIKEARNKEQICVKTDEKTLSDKKNFLTINVDNEKFEKGLKHFNRVLTANGKDYTLKSFISDLAGLYEPNNDNDKLFKTSNKALKYISIKSPELFKSIDGHLVSAVTSRTNCKSQDDFKKAFKDFIKKEVSKELERNQPRW